MKLISSEQSNLYDSLGNRVSDNNGSSAYDAKKSILLEDYKYLYTYDSNGNQISKTEKGLNGNFTQYEYSSENQLIKASKYVSNNLTMESNYKYDALGRRMQKIVSYPNNPTKSFVRKYAYDGEEILISYDESNNILATYTQSTLRTDDTLAVDVTTIGKANKIAKEAGSFMFLKDALGSITDITDDSGSLVEHIAYSSFGKISKVTDAAGADKLSDRYFNIPYSYTNREFDSETDLYHYRARAYDASIGRFLQEDPDSGHQELAKTTFNKYIYGLNNPMVFTDPEGEFPWAVFIAFGLLQGMTNYLQAIDAGADSERAWGSFAVGFLAGAASAVVGGGPVIAAFQIFSISVLHNAINQMIFTGNVEWGAALLSGSIAGLTGGLGYKIANKFNISWAPGFSAWSSNGGQWLINNTTTSSGIPTRCDKANSNNEVRPSYQTTLRLCM